MKPYYNILRIDGGREPKVKHATLEGAQAEALRLAGQHPGSAFEILQCLAIAQTSQPALFWNDGCEPAAPTYRMLEAGEVIEEGDEFLVAGSDNGWLKRQLNIGQPWHPELYSATRRPINNSKP